MYGVGENGFCFGLHDFVWLLSSTFGGLVSSFKTFFDLKYITVRNILILVGVVGSKKPRALNY